MGTMGGRSLTPSPHSILTNSSILAVGYINLEEGAPFSNLYNDIICVNGGLHGTSGNSDNWDP